MKKITIKKLIEFRAKNDRTKITFVYNLKKENIKSENSASGGDYWISCLSAIRNAFKYDNADLLDEKINTLTDKIRVSEIKKIKDQFQRNIDILNSFKDYDLQQLKPDADLSFLKQSKSQMILKIKDLPIEAKPCLVFTFSKDGKNQIGGIWFIAQLKGFKKNELGMFADIIYRYLKKHYSKDYHIDSFFCTAVDLFNGQEVNYSEILDGKIPVLIDSTLIDLKKI